MCQASQNYCMDLTEPRLTMEVCNIDCVLPGPGRYTTYTLSLSWIIWSSPFLILKETKSSCCHLLVPFFPLHESSFDMPLSSLISLNLNFLTIPEVFCSVWFLKVSFHWLHSSSDVLMNNEDKKAAWQEKGRLNIQLLSN